MKKSIFMPKVELRDDKIIASNDTTKENLLKAKKKTILKFPSLETVLKRVNIFDNGSSTHGGLAATNGHDIEVNGNAIGNDPEAWIFPLAHEAEHIKRNDIGKMATYSDQKVANVVTDAVINEDLRNSGVTPNHNVVQIAGANSLGVDKLYDIITETAQFIANDTWAGKTPEVTLDDLNKSFFGDHGLWNRVVFYHAEKNRELNEKQNPKQADKKEQEKQQKNEPESKNKQEEWENKRKQEQERKNEQEKAQESEKENKNKQEDNAEQENEQENGFGQGFSYNGQPQQQFAPEMAM
ncbi:MAG: hypothetical protein LBQ05_01500 [Christensenellaceae bacterium]|jgi:flagellar biosynthesis GTPase FlhF|nr:hypothetical protein [Christensenellaceae bacterium]